MAKKKPNIRFKGFEEEWKEKTLGNMGETYNGLSGKTKEDFGHGDAQFVTYMNVFSNPVASPTGVDNVEIDPSQNEVKKGDILFTTSSETPDEVGMSSVWMEDKPNTYLNSFCFGYRLNEPLDPYFSAYLMRSPKIRNDFYFLAQGISRFNISKQKAMDIETAIPNKAEQQKIGEFFKQLDELIGAKEEELEKLRQIKLALLDKMFPSDNQDVTNTPPHWNSLIISKLSKNLVMTTPAPNSPAIRFRGFTEPWENCPITQRVAFGKGRGYSKASLEVEGTPILLYGMMYTDYCTNITSVNRFAQKRDWTVLSKGNEVVVPASGETAEDIARASAVLNDGVILGGDLNVIYPDQTLYPPFLALELTYGRSHRKLVKKAQGISVVHLHNSDIAELDISIPSYDEQQKIGDFFRQQDEAISSSELQIEKLKNIKQACLQQMFA